MSGDAWVSALVALVTEPTFGIPLLATIALLLGWIIWSPNPGERRAPALRRSWFEPSEDLPSRVYYALADGQYSRVLDATAGRLDEVVLARRGVSVYQLPVREARAERMGIPDARELRHALRQVSRTHAEAIEREGSFYVRWRFWRSAADDRRDYLARVDDAVGEAAHWIHKLEENS